MVFGLWSLDETDDETNGLDNRQDNGLDNRQDNGLDNRQDNGLLFWTFVIGLDNGQKKLTQH